VKVVDLEQHRLRRPRPASLADSGLPADSAVDPAPASGPTLQVTRASDAGATPSDSRPPEHAVLATARLLATLRGLLRTPASLLPGDPVILQYLIGRAQWPDANALRMQLAALIRAGELRCVYIDREPHLALPRESSAADGDDMHAANQLATVPPAESRATIIEQPVPNALPDGAASDFQLRVEVDIETERVLLYRVALVVSGIVALVLLRALAVVWLTQ
jgi:hypothetical protein